MNLINRLFLTLFILLCLPILASSCRKFIDVDSPVTNVTNESVYNSDATAASVLTGVYIKLSMASFPVTFNIPAMSIWTGLSADELILWSDVSDPQLNAYYSNSLSRNSYGSEFWSNAYIEIFTINSAIKGISSSTGMSQSVKSQLLGEAKFLRAFFYFYLVNLYGDVPLILNTQYKENSIAPRAPVDQVYSQIVADLIEAKSLLSAQYLNADIINVTGDRVRPTKWAASALLSRVYLYRKDFANAEAEATIVLNNSDVFSLCNINDVFKKNSLEAIWQLQPVNDGWNTEDAKVLILPSTGPNPFGNPVYLSDEIMRSFEPGDLRKSFWVDSIVDNMQTFYFPFKYKINTSGAPVEEYLTLFRLAELHLIRSEARANLGKLSEARTDLNAVRHRAGLIDIDLEEKQFLLAKISQERMVELFTECSHRWLDLKRSGLINKIMTEIEGRKQVKWSSTDQLYPLPLSDLQKNTNLTQNPGY